jgi:hypothetical protein
MKHTITSFKLIGGIAAMATTLVAGTLVSGCESTDGGNTGGANINSNTNYGTGRNEPRPPDPVIMIEPTTGAGPRGGGGR